MKKLNNDFTTPEQSNRLLEMGVPMWTSDCGLTDNVNPYLIAVKYNQIAWRKQYIPCWSVGRLMEILGICISYSHYELMIKAANRIVTPIDYMIKVLEDEMELGNIDFSKLEEE